MATFNLKRNDTSPSIIIDLKKPDGTAQSITGATSTRFHMMDATGVVKVDDDVTTVLDAANGQVQYDWVAADTDTAGEFRVEIEVTFSDGTIETFPNASYIVVTITADVT